jgi:hypothetical protein
MAAATTSSEKASTMYCGTMSITQAQGLNKDEWLKGCSDGATKK